MSSDGMQFSGDGSGQNEYALGTQENGFQQSSSVPGGRRKQVQFNEEGQSIGEGSAQFSTFVGRIVRKHCPPAYASWHSLPDALKEQLWNMIVVEYDVPHMHKGAVLLRANTAWRQWKYELRKHLDTCGKTIVERKINIPRRIRKEDWEQFVDFCSKEEDQVRREKGKASRKKMKNLHTFGRRGAARIAEELKMSSDGMQLSGDGSEQNESALSTEESGFQQSDDVLCGRRKLVEFNEDGQSIGEGSAQFSTFVGRIVRKHCPPAYASWHSLPTALKEQLWNMIVSEYDVPHMHKGAVFLKANTAWRQWKHQLRKHFDTCGKTIVERKRNIPRRIRKEDWEEFVDFCSKEEEQVRREKGKASRKKMKSPHTSGRRGAASIAEELKKESPTGAVTRTKLYIATHTKKDGTCPFPTMAQDIDQIRRLLKIDPFLDQKDLDNDPVALVYGRDGKGRVRGMGSGVTKTSIRIAAPYKEVAQRERRAREGLEKKVQTMDDKLDKLVSQFGSFHGSQMQDSSEFCSSLHVKTRRSSVEDESSEHTTSFRHCLLRNFKKKIVAFGHLNRDMPPSQDSYSITIDDVLDTNAELYEGEGRLGDILLGDTITWPKPNIEFV